MGKREILNLIAAFAVVALIIGMIMAMIAEDYTLTDDLGKGIVIVSFSIAAVCEIILWISRKRKK